MNKRIRKKLSKRIFELLPDRYRYAWKCKFSGEMRVGGGTSWCGVPQESKSIYEHYCGFTGGLEWLAIFGMYPDNHCLSGYPVPDNKQLTARRAIWYAKIESAGLVEKTREEFKVRYAAYIRSEVEQREGL